MASPPTYNHVVEVNGPHRVIYIAGQTGVDKDGKVAQGFHAQVVQVMENIKIALAAVGGSFDDIVKLNSYLVDIAANQPIYRDVRASYSRARQRCQRVHPSACRRSPKQAI
jgi:enamine deaminase RidA (YjgF/YER057c/UK114 family)